MEEHGEAPRRWLFSEPRRLASFGPRCWAGHAHSGYPNLKPPSGQRAPPLRCQASFTESLGPCPEKRKPSLPPRGPQVFPWTTFPSRSPTRVEAECQGRTRDLGPGRGAGHGSTPGEGGPVRRDPHPRSGSPVGSQALALPWQLRVLLCLKLPHPAPRWQTLTLGLPSSCVW